MPPCAAPEDWEKKSDEWREKAEITEKELWEVYQKNDLLKEELAGLESQLISCGCENGEKKKEIYSMPTASGATAEVNQKLRKDGAHHSLRQDVGVRGRMHGLEQKDVTSLEEELG